MNQKRGSFWFLSMLAMVFQLALMTGHASAISPEEQLGDPAQEARARALSQQLRCLVCENQSIDESDADLAVDLRREVRALISAGQSDDAILSQLQNTYGAYILLKPPVLASTYLLWLSPIFLVLAAGGLFYHWRRGLSAQTTESADISEASTLDNSLPPAESTVGMKPTQLILFVGLIIGLTALLYSQLGRPDIAARPAAERAAERAEAMAEEQAQRSAARAELDAAQQIAASNPDSVAAQLRLAMIAASSGAFDEEIAALEQALRLTNNAPAITAMMAEALSRKADGLVTLPARNLIAEVLAQNPEEPRALYLAGLAAYQDEDYAAAAQRWVALARITKPDAPWAAVLADNIAQAAEAGGFEMPALPDQLTAGPDQDDIAALSALSEADRSAQISAMVEGLESRLTDAPDDPQGWAQLIRAREVMQDIDGLGRALFGAAAAQPQEKAAQLAVLEFLLSHARETLHMDEAERALKRLQQIETESLEWLFFAGHFAKIDGDNEMARLYWEKLHGALPDDTRFAAQLKSQIDSLN
ncbi:MAG: cytochrome c-type biogenesis protein CcmH [Candidatus Puniceispirillaceae bacterium]